MRATIYMTLCTVALLAAGTSTAQTRHMMNDSPWGGGWMAGYGVIWVPLLLVLLGVVVAAVLVERTGK